MPKNNSKTVDCSKTHDQFPDQLFWFCFNFIFTNSHIELLCWSPPFPHPLSYFTLYNVCAVLWGCSVPWGVFSTVGDILSTMEGYLEYHGGISWVLWGISWVPWGYHEYHGGYRVPWGLSSTMGVIEYHGGYHGYRGRCSVPWGESFVIWVPHGAEHPTVLMISHISPHGTHDISPRASWYPHGTQDIPHIYHGISPRYSRYPPRYS